MSWIASAVWRWLALAGLYLVFAGTLSASEIAAALLTAGLATVGALILRERAERTFRFDPAWLWALAPVPAALLRDAGRVALAASAALVRPVHGRIARRRTAEPRRRAARAGHKAIEILATSIAPNEYVIKDDDATLTIHQLAAGRPQRGAV